MPPLSSPASAARGFYLGVFFGRPGSDASRWADLEKELVALATSLNATLAYQGPGGAPCFERSVILSTASAYCLDRLERFVAVRFPVGPDSLLPHGRLESWPPAVALALSEEEFQHAVAREGSMRLRVEPVLVADFSALLEARRADAGAPPLRSPR